jgi:hypothetical protein
VTENENIDWKAAYESVLEAHRPIIVDANRYRFLRDHTFVEAYWIDGADGVDTKIRVEGAGEHLDLAVDMERIKEARDSYNAGPLTVSPDGTELGRWKQGFPEIAEPGMGGSENCGTHGWQGCPVSSNNGDPCRLEAGHAGPHRL